MGRNVRECAGAVLGAALLLWPAAAPAQDLRAEIEGLLRARGCAMTEEALAEVFTVMGRSPEEVREAVAGLVAAGSALREDGELRLLPESCRPQLPSRVPPLPWIEERLAEAPGCRRALPGLRAEAEKGGIAGEAFGRVVSALEDLGRIVVEDGTARLRPDLCGPDASRDRGLDRVLLLRRNSFRAVLGLLAMNRGCRLPLGDREALVRDLALVAREQLLLGSPLSEEAVRALSRRLSEALDDPGPAFRAEGGELVAIYCRP